MIKDFKTYLNESQDIFVGKEAIVNNKLENYIQKHMWSRDMYRLIGKTIIPTSFDEQFFDGAYIYNSWKIPMDCLTFIEDIEKYKDEDIQWF